MSANNLFAIAVHTMSVLGYLHKKGTPRVSSQLIAKSVNTNAVVIRRLLLQLKKAHLIDSKEGKTGGVSLARDPGEITLNDIFSAVEVSGFFSENKRPAFKKCPISCGMKKVLPSVFQDVEKAVMKSLQGKTLLSVIQQLE